MLKRGFELGVGEEADRFQSFLHGYLERCAFDLAPLKATRLQLDGREHRTLSFATVNAGEVFVSRWRALQGEDELQVAA